MNITIEEEEEIVENYCKTRNMFLITASGLEQIIEEATLNGYKKGYEKGYNKAYQEIVDDARC